MNSLKHFWGQQSESKGNTKEESGNKLINMTKKNTLCACCDLFTSDAKDCPYRDDCKIK